VNDLPEDGLVNVIEPAVDVIVLLVVEVLDVAEVVLPVVDVLVV
jgi:hypothetical protein